MGWSYWDLMALPAEVYVVLVEQLRTEAEKRQSEVA
jgi:hypothetical protein